MQRRGYLGKMATPSDRDVFRRAIRIAKEKGAIVTTHDMPDADGLGSAFCIQKHLRSEGAQADVAVGQKTAITERFVSELKMDIRNWKDISTEDRRPLIIVDTNSPALLSCSAIRKNPQLLVIDHHKLMPPLLKPRFMINNEAAISACEIVASLIPKERIDSTAALALAIGIAGDSERLNFAEIRTLSIFESLLAISKAPKKTIDALAYPPWKSDMVVAVLEEMKHLHTETYLGRVIAVASSRLEQPSILATVLRDLNVNIIAVLNEIGNGWYKISFRVDLKEAHENGIHANEIAVKISKAFGMPKKLVGGGHIDKAGAMVRGAYQDIVSQIIKTTKEALDRAERVAF